MIRFAQPWVFLFLPLLGWWMWRFPGFWHRRPLRIFILILFCLAWSDPLLDRSVPGLDLWVLYDQSDSARESVAPRLPEIDSLLRESKGPHDRLFQIDFAGEALQRDPMAAPVPPSRPQATEIGNALQYTLSLRDARRQTRLLLLTDGFATGPLDRAGERLLREGLPLDLRLFQPASVLDARVDSLEAPLRVRPGEPFLLQTAVSGPPGQTARLRLLLDGQELDNREVTFALRPLRVQWTARVAVPGAARYEVRLETDPDAYAGNNRQSRWVEAAGSGRVLLLSAYADDPLAPALRAAGLDVWQPENFSNLGPGSLSAVSVLWIHNVHASRLPRAFLEALPFYVREQGGGLIMAGGKAAFGAGGYFDSPVDKLLPVSMELKEEDRKLSVAMAIVMDRSGSMSMGVAGGFTKMELANTGAARAIELLGEMDAVAVYAVDTEAHEILPLRSAGRNRAELIRIVRRIQSGGGGIYVFNGLQAAWSALKDAPQGQRHIILFSDASDSEQPEGVSELIQEMRAANTTVSVIALGSPQDSDAPFLEQIALEGNGRIFYNEDPATLPEVFAQETVTVSRSAFLEEPVALEARPDWFELAATPLDWLAQVDGYNLSYLREGAGESLRALDGEGAPLLAHWTRGAGRVAAVSFPLGGAFSESVREWPDYGDFIRTLTRWAQRGELPQGLALRSQTIGETLRIQLHADEKWQEVFARLPPVLSSALGGDNEIRTHVWSRIGPGRFETDLPLSDGEVLRGALRAGKEVIPFGPVSGVSGAEWRFDLDALSQLRDLSLRSGGQERLDLEGIWDSPRQRTLRGTGTLWLALCGLLFLWEALWNRLGGQLPEWGVLRWRREPKEKPGASKATSSGTTLPAAPPPPSAPKIRRSLQQARHPRRRG